VSANLDKGLPSNVDAERFILGSIVLDGSFYVQAAGALAAEDFSLEKHRRIFKRMGDLQSRGENIDRVTVANELMKCGELESCDGLSYLVSLDEGLPRIANIDSYIRIVLDKSTLRRIIFACQHLQNRCISGEELAAEVLAGAGETWLRLAERGQESTLLGAAEIVEQAGGISAYLDRRNRTKGLLSKFGALDVMMGGFKPGAFYILGARPRMGKTAFALNVAEKVSVDGDALTLIFSLEMDRASLLDRLICSRARVNTKRFDGGFLDKEERGRIATAATAILESDRILIDDKATTNLHEIHAKIRQQQVKRPVGLVIIDYLQLLIDGRVEHRVAEASKISRDMKLIAKDCKVPVWALAQLSRECDKRPDPRPQLSDLRESGSLEQDADLVAFLFREEVYKRDREDLRGLADLIVAKQRAGPEGVIPLVWINEIVRFEERAMGSEPEG
jgi:replicative DNA helicase